MIYHRRNQPSYCKRTKDLLARNFAIPRLAAHRERMTRKTEVMPAGLIAPLLPACLSRSRLRPGWSARRGAENTGRIREALQEDLCVFLPDCAGLSWSAPERKAMKQLENAYQSTLLYLAISRWIQGSTPYGQTHASRTSCTASGSPNKAGSPQRQTAHIPAAARQDW